MPSGTFSRSPKQNRSKESFERVLETATVLLEKHGFNGFSIVDVSRKAKISIGSIYGRVASKDDLVRCVQERVLDIADAEHNDFIARLDQKGMTLAETFPLAVQNYAEFLANHAGIFHAFISRASSDPVLRKRGKRSAGHFTDGVVKLLLRHRGEITHPDPDRAALACSRLMWSSFGSFLGIESDESAGEGNWNELIEDVTQMGMFFLLPDERAIQMGQFKVHSKTEGIAAARRKSVLAARAVASRLRKRK